MRLYFCCQCPTAFGRLLAQVKEEDGRRQRAAQLVQHSGADALRKHGKRARAARRRFSVQVVACLQERIALRRAWPHVCRCEPGWDMSFHSTSLYVEAL